MKNYKIGYARVPAESQNPDRQLNALKKYGVDMICNEKMTGTKKDRPELRLPDRMAAGGVIAVESLSHLGRSTKNQHQGKHGVMKWITTIFMIR